jgi:hypothetical protein
MQQDRRNGQWQITARYRARDGFGIPPYPQQVRHGVRTVRAGGIAAKRDQEAPGQFSMRPE